MTVIARVFGGLGNQLFIYASARALAARAGTKLMLDTVSGFEEDRLFGRVFLLDHFNVQYTSACGHDPLLQPTGAGKAARAIARRINRMLPENRRFYFTDGMDPFRQEATEKALRSRIYLDGYWQDEANFRDIAQQTRRELTLKKPPTAAAAGLAGRMRKEESVAVHYRTQVGTGNDQRGMKRLPASYYRACLLELRARLKAPHLYCFMDADSQLSEDLTGGLPYTVITHENPNEFAFEDIWLMAQCRHFVIANSTFSWWGAWLGSDPGKLVLAPLHGKESSVLSGFPKPVNSARSRHEESGQIAISLYAASCEARQEVVA